MYQEGRGYSALRRGRVSVPEATYFVTLCVQGNGQRLDSADMILSVHSVLLALEEDGSIVLRVATIMPDHVHLLFRLKERLTFSRVIARFKAKTWADLAKRGLRWQENVFERRLRPDEPVLPVFHYIFMNPYRAKLLQGFEKWPGFRCGVEDWEWFQHHLDKDCPYPEWLGD